MYKIIILLLVLIIMTSCQGDEPRKEADMRELTEISLLNLKSTRSEDMFKRVEFIQLQEGPDRGALLKNVSKIEIIDDLLYILDQGTNALYVYTLKGVFVKKIENPGQGPTTINLISDFSFNRFTKKIELLSPKGKLVSYDEKLNQFSDEIFVGNEILPALAFSIIDEKNILFYTSNSEGYLVLVDRESGKIGESFVSNLKNEAISLHHFSPFLEKEGEIYFYDNYQHKVHDVSKGEDGGIVYSFDFMENNLDMTPELFGEIVSSGDLLNFINANNFIYPVGHFFEDDKYLFMQGILSGKKIISLVFDKTARVWNYSDITSLGIFSALRCKIDDKYVGVMKDPENLREKFGDGVISEAQKKYADNIRPDGNPVLVLYSFD